MGLIYTKENLGGGTVGPPPPKPAPPRSSEKCVCQTLVKQALNYIKTSKL